jgi:hypothetical protein
MANNSVITLTSNNQNQITTNNTLGNIVFGLATTGVVAGSYVYYTNFQVDAYGRITSTTATSILEPMGNSAYAFANTGYTQANNAASFANGAFTQANSAASFANGAFTAANTKLANTGTLITSNGSSQFYFANTTTSTSPSTGSIVVAGGMGVVGTLNVASLGTGNVVIKGSGGVYFNDGTYITTSPFPIYESNVLVTKINSGVAFTLGNSKTYTLTTGGEQFMDVYVDGYKLVKGNDYAETSTSSITTTFSIPVGSTIEFRIER